MNFQSRSFISFGFMWFVIVMVGCCAVVSAQALTSELIQAGTKLDRDLAGGASQQFSISLQAGQFLKVVVEQKGIDVVVRLLDADGQILTEVDSPNGTEGPEPLAFVAKKPGLYQVQVESLEKEAPAGKYTLTVDAIRPATKEDRAGLRVGRLNTKTQKLYQDGQSDAAFEAAKKAAAVAEKRLSADDPELAVALNNLAIFHRDRGELPQAVQLFQRVIPIFEKAFGPDHPQLATALNNLGIVLRDQGEYVLAEPMLQRSNTILEKMLGPEDPNLAAGFSNLGLVYFNLGEYRKAETLLVKALAIAEKVAGPEHPLVGTFLNILAGVYQTMGDYVRAEPLYQRSLAIREKAFGPDHPTTAATLNNLALLSQTKGDFAQAEPIFQRTLRIWEKTAGPEHPNTAVALNNLALLYQDKGDLAQAETTFGRALAIREKVLGPEHPDVAITLTNLGLIAKSRGNLKLAEDHFRRVLAIREKVLGLEHPDVADILCSLGMLKQETGHLAEGEPMLLRAWAIDRKSLGEKHPDVAGTASLLAEFYQREGQLEKAIGYQVQANDIREHELALNLVAGSERQKVLYLNQSQTDLDQTLSLLAADDGRNREGLRAGLTVVLRRKGRSLDAMADSIQTLRQRASAEDRALLDELTAAKTALAVASLQSGGVVSTTPLGKRIAALEVNIERLETKISARSVEFRVQTQPITLEAIQKTIPPDATLVEYAVFRSFDPKTRRLGAPHYGVFVLGSKGEPQWADLGDAQVIESAVDALRQALGQRSSAVKRLARNLEQLIFAPVRALAGANARWFLLSPDGRLSLVPFAALVDAKGQFLVENYLLGYVTSGRDLLRLEASVNSGGPPVIVADPEYGQGDGPILAGNRYKPLSRLEGTEQEGQFIQKLFPKAQLLVKGQATKKALKEIARPVLLHIATHGYFLETTASLPMLNVADMRLLEREESTLPFNIEAWRGASPLLRAWLFLAGANAPSQNDDGTLTALEATGLDLWGTKLVVLAACDTGVGDVKNGDGVYGLRRALVLAGSETQMMSLWPVSDTGTRELMMGFYQRLQAGEGRAQALRNAQLHLLKNARWRHPYYWASFIQSGVWSPITTK